MSLLSPIDIPKGKHVLRILDGNGDTPLVYDPLDEAEMAGAIAAFEAQMPKNPRVYAFTDTERGGGHVTDVLEPTDVEVIVAPQSVGG